VTSSIRRSQGLLSRCCWEYCNTMSGRTNVRHAGINRHRNDY